MKEKKEPAGSKTGKYVYDKNTGKLVKVSDRATAAKKNAGPSAPSCGTGGCCCCG